MSGDPPEADLPAPWYSRPRLWLALMVLSFFGFSVYAGIIGYYDFQLNNSTDAGIITQAVASTAHGGVPPFFESWDCLFKGRCSFLLVHPGFVLYATVPAFDLFPSTLTLFAIRAAIVAAAALPLYWLTRQLTGSTRWALLSAGVYLIWAPTSTDDFSLHLESFLPLEILLLVALWQAGRYRSGLLVALTAFLTIEIAPVFTFLVGVFFLVPMLGPVLSGIWARWKSRREFPFSYRTEWASLGKTIWKGRRERPVRYALLLMGASIIAYVVLYSFMNVWGAHLLGVAPPTTGTGLSGLFYNPSTPAVAPIPALLTSPQTLLTAEYWLLLYGLLAFIPLLSPRALILSVPWIGWTFLSDSSRFTTLGHQYSFIAAGPIFVGFAFGLQHVAGRIERPSGPTSGEVTAAGSRIRRRYRNSRGAMLAGVLAFVIVANVLFSPVDPALADLGLVARAPIDSNYFDHSLSIVPGYDQVDRMIGTIPAGATVAVPSALYALLAPRPDVYLLRVTREGSTSLMPFNVSQGPDFFLIYPGFASSLSVHASANLTQPGLYGMRAYVADTSLGPVFLYQRGASSPASPFGPALSATSSFWVPGDGLSPGPIATQAANSSASSGRIIASNLSSHRTGTIWTGNTSTLAPGSYEIDIEVALTGVNGSVRPDAPVLQIRAGGFGASLLAQNLTFAELPEQTWVDVEFNATTSNPVPVFTVEGDLRDPNCAIAVASVSIVADGGS